MLNEIFVYYIDFKNSIPATSTINEDGTYTIFINSRVATNQQADGYIHELNHILQLDFEKRTNNVNILEYYSHIG